jgi:hypothetical protein
VTPIWPRRFEVAVLILVSWLLGPAICVAAFAVMIAAFASLHGGGSSHMRSAELGGEGILLAVLLSALAGLAATWITVLAGACNLRGNAARRRALQVCIALGAAAACYWLVWVFSSNWGLAHVRVWVYWSALVVLPLAVGLRQFVLLASGGTKSPRDPG